MQSTKEGNHDAMFWVRWKKPVITLDPDDVDGAQDISNSYRDKYIKIEMPFNSLMIELFKVAILMI